VPGPVCYAKGGQEPTITDANVILGYLNPRHLLGGAMPIDATAARRAFQEAVAAPLGLALVEAAHGVHELANATMIRAVKAVSTYRGRDPRDCALFAFGGSGPIHAAGMARELQIGRVLVPPAPGLYSAFGLLGAAIQHHTVRTFLRPVDQLDLAELAAAFRALEVAALAELTVQGYAPEQITRRRSADLRYLGQSFELTVPVPSANGQAIDRGTLAAVAEAFGQEHRRTYGHRPGQPVEIVNLRLTTTVDRETHPIRTVATGPGAGRQTTATADPGPVSARREAYFGPAFGTHLTPVLARADLSERPSSGPLIVEEYDATVVVPPDCVAYRDGFGNIIIDVGDG
jgi:N-methylhydantoinase A